MIKSSVKTCLHSIGRHTKAVSEGMFILSLNTCLMHVVIWTFCGRRPSVEDDLHRKTTSCVKTTFVGRQPLVKDNLQWKMTFNGRLTWMEDNL